MIDPSIALQVRPPQFADPLEQQAKATNLLAARQQLAMAPLHVAAAQQQLESGRLANQKAQTDIDEEAQFKAALGRNAKPFELLSIAPKLASGHLKAITEQEKTNLDNLKTKTGLFSQALGSVKYAPPEQQADQWAKVRAGAIQQGVIRPEDTPEQYDPAFVDQHFRAAIDADKQIDDHQKELDFQQRVIAEAPDTAKKWMEVVQREGSATKSQADLDQTRAKLEGMGVPKGLLSRALPAMWSETAVNALAERAMTPEQRAQVKLRAEEIAKLNTPAELAAVASNSAKTPQERQTAKDALKILEQHAIASRPVMNMSLPGVPNPGTNNNLTGEDLLKALPPGIAAEIRGMAEGRLTAPSASSRAPGAQQKRALLMQYEPGYSEQRAQIRKALITGPDGRNIGNLNTSAVHLGQMVEAAEAMRNGSWQPGNALYNYISEKFGSDKPTNYAFVMNAFGGEAANALKGQATDPEIAHILSTIKPDMSPEQALGIGKTGLHVLGAKLNTYDERYHAQSTPDDPWSPMLPSAKAVFAKYGQNPITRQTGNDGSNGNTTGGRKPLSEIFK